MFCGVLQFLFGFKFYQKRKQTRTQTQFGFLVPALVVSLIDGVIDPLFAAGEALATGGGFRLLRCGLGGGRVGRGLRTPPLAGERRGRASLRSAKHREAAVVDLSRRSGSRASPAGDESSRHGSVKRIQSGRGARTGRTGVLILLHGLDRVNTLEKGVKQRGLARSNDLVEVRCVVHMLQGLEDFCDELVALRKEFNRVALLGLDIVDVIGVLVKTLKKRLKPGQHRHRIRVRVDVACHKDRRNHRANEREVQHARVLGHRQHSVEILEVDTLGQQTVKIERKVREHQRNLLTLGRNHFEALVREPAVEVDARLVKHPRKLRQHLKDVVQVVAVHLNLSALRKLTVELGGGKALEAVHARVLLAGVDSADHRIDVRELLVQQHEDPARKKRESLRDGVLDARESKAKGGAGLAQLRLRNGLRVVGGDRGAFARRCLGNHLGIELNLDADAVQSRKVRPQELEQVVHEHAKTLGHQAATRQVLDELLRQAVGLGNLDDVGGLVDMLAKLVENIIARHRELLRELALVQEAVHRHDEDQQNLRHLVRRESGLRRLVVVGTTSGAGLGLGNQLGKSLVSLGGLGGLGGGSLLDGRRGRLEVGNDLRNDILRGTNVLEGLGNQFKNLVRRNRNLFVALEISEAHGLTLGVGLKGLVTLVGLRGLVTLVGLRGHVDGGRASSHVGKKA